MKTAPYEYIIKTVGQTNILPVTSDCTMGCVFCSHKNNPKDIDAYRLPQLSFEEIINICEFLDGNKKIVIGESASRIIEGEPFLRGDLLSILKHLRTKFKHALIEITTNGVYLTEDTALKLKEVEPIEMNISLNSSTLKGRGMLYHSKDTYGAVEGIEHLKNNNIKFHGSIVAMPDIAGYSDIEDTINFLCEMGASTIRVFVPGFSSFSKYKVDFFSIRNKLNEIADSLYSVHGVPILVEPPEIKSLEPLISGIIQGSPASYAGLQKWDVIVKVGSLIPKTRVDAYNILYKIADPEIVVKRGDRILSLNLQKHKDSPSGAVFYYDIAPETLEAIERAVIRHRSKNPLLVTSELAYPVIRMGMETLSKKIEVLKVQSRWFGGTIMCTGLLTSDDIVDAVKNSGDMGKYDLIILPKSPFDINGRDMAGKSFYTIEESTGIPTVICA